MQVWLKKIVFILIAALVIGFILYSWPTSCNTTFKGIKYRLGNSSNSENVSVSINGKFKRATFFNNREFEGTIDVNGKKMTNVKLKFENSGRGNIVYQYDSQFLHITSYGDLFVSDDLKRINFCVLEPEAPEEVGGSWNGESGLMISGPAQNRQEALLVSNELMKNALHEKLK